MSRRVKIKMRSDVPEGFGPGEDTLSGSESFGRRDLARFREVLAKKMLGAVHEGSGADTS